MNKMVKSYFPLHCTKVRSVCSSPGASRCAEMIGSKPGTALNYNHCSRFKSANKLDQARTRIMLTNLRIAGEVKELMGGILNHNE